MRRSFNLILLGTAFALMIVSAAFAGEITGAGATFPYPVYAKWAEAYKAKTGIGMNYQSIGSGGGIKQITAGTVQFGASDKPLTPEELEKDGLVQFPTVMGGVVPVLNVKEVAAGKLKLTGAVLAKIYLGQITKWDAPEIAQLNPDLKLPADDITVVHRSDGSGTTFIFTNYLSKTSPDWKEKIGNDASVAWPVGVGGKGNEGVASYVQRIVGSIGYVEYAYALQNKMSYALLQNQAGEFVKPEAKNFQAAAAFADWAKAPGFYQILTDQPGKESWPITGATFILMHKMEKDPKAAKQVLEFFKWAYANGGKMAEELDYIPMPDNVVKLIFEEWKKIKGPDDKAVI
ncbi:MAG: phosphate ABC transporter substrate-binding protein PstS [Desulfobacteraceae bacterium]|nr:phosphate ABC transporter substrate-binding protein PstS [Desulfobacteraceae bacterium]